MTVMIDETMEHLAFNLPTAIMDISLNVRDRLRQLREWEVEWQVEDELLNQRLAQLDPTKNIDIQRGEQLIRLQKRLQLKLVKEPIEISAEVVLQVGYEALHRHLVQQFAALSRKERLLWLNNFLFIMTPDLRRLNDKIAKVRSYRSFGQQRNFLLGGHSGMGKSTYLDWFAAHNAPRVLGTYTQVPVVKVDAPVSNKTPKPLFQRMILETGMTYAQRDNEEDLLMKLVLFLHRCKTELVVVDEIEHITRSHLRRRLLEVSNLTRGLPIIGASCEPLNWSAGDSEVAGRWNDYFELKQYTGERLRQILTYIELLLPFTQLSMLPQEKVIDEEGKVEDGSAVLIERWTGGILRDIMILIIDACRRAIERDLPCLSVSLLKESWADIQTQQVVDFLDTVRNKKDK